MTTVLLVDDKENIRTVMGAVIRREGFEVLTAADGREALDLALERTPDLVLSDVRMDGMSGTELFRELRSRGISAPFVFMTAYASVPDAVDAIRDGAVHYLTKPVDYGELLRIIRRAVLHKSGEAQAERSSSRSILGSGPAVRKLLARIEAVAASEATVLIRGENGTGKELAARAIHSRSPRRNGPFVPVHCAALNPNLLESELFGHEAGAFTGALRRKEGYLEAARGGTLFLDEVSEIGPETQVKLLRVLQERAYSRVGGTDLVRADFRLLAATNRNLEALVAAGTFRSDLYYRLDVVPLSVPPLRERREDIPELVEHFAGRVAAAEGLDRPGTTEDFLAALKGYLWPGNVRELENLVERLVVLYRPKVLEARLLEEEAPDRFGPMDPDARERTEILDALRRSGGNKSAAARSLGISRRALYYRMSRLGIEAGDAPGND
ncbi:MAG TPA: sigma-54 dependent transcriptional regulator [Spirochaetales bacterium]|nr:sigma-54 dependent transcriptional regulator [Spirochaetales bacterium]